MTAMGNESLCSSMPNSNIQQFQQQKPLNLEQIQNSVEAKKELKYQPSVPQAQTQSNIVNCNIPEWTISDDNKNNSLTADRGEPNVLTLPQGAYYGNF